MVYTLDDELRIADDETVRVSSYWDRDDQQQKYFDAPVSFEPGDEILLGHVSPEAPFRYQGVVDRDGVPHLQFDTTSDFPVTEIVISPAKFMLAMGDDIWYY